MSGFVLDEKHPPAFTEVSDYVADLAKFVDQMMEHSHVYGDTFGLIDSLRTMVRLLQLARRHGEHGFVGVSEVI